MSKSQKIERKTKAIMFTDIAGYTQAMSKSEQKALEMLRKKRTIIKTLIDNYEGKYIKEIGDGTLSYFESGYNASTCAKELQKLVKTEDLNVRVGIHIGDIVFDNDDVYGDGVNVASRLESIAPAGGVLISKNVYDELINKDDFDGVSLGLQSLKGVGRLVEVYAIKDEYLVIPKTDDYKATEVEVHKDDEVPSLAIIPFKNKGAEEDVFYAYGISADLISDCSGAGLIRVESLDNIEKIDGYTKMVSNDIASKLLVRYVSTGTLWKMGNMFQLSIELYDTKEKKVVWSDRWQEKWDNLPSIKNKLSDGILIALNTKPEGEKKVETTNSEAYELYLKAKQKSSRLKNIDDIEIVQGLLDKSIKLDNNLISAKLLLASTYSHQGNYDQATKILNISLAQSKEINDRDLMANCYNSLGIIQFHQGDFKNEIKSYEKSLEIYKKIDNKSGTALLLNNIASLLLDHDINKALRYFRKSFEINRELEDKQMMALTLERLGASHEGIGEFRKSIDYYHDSINLFKKIKGEESKTFLLKLNSKLYFLKGNLEKVKAHYKDLFKIYEEVGFKRNMGEYLLSIADILFFQNNLQESLDYYKKSLSLYEEIEDSYGVANSLSGIGSIHLQKSNYQKAQEYFENSFNYLKKCGGGDLDLLAVNSKLYLTYKYQEKEYDIKEFYNSIKNTKNIKYEINFELYELIGDKQYLEDAYNILQDKLDIMSEKLKKEFLNYRLPKKIIEEYNKVFNKASLPKKTKIKS